MGFAGGDNGVTRDELGEDTTGGLNAKGESGNVDEDNILSAFLPREYTALNRGTVCNSLVRVDTLGRLPATEELFKELLDLGDTCRTANEYDLL